VTIPSLVKIGTIIPNLDSRKASPGPYDLIIFYTDGHQHLEDRANDMALDLATTSR